MRTRYVIPMVLLLAATLMGCGNSKNSSGDDYQHICHVQAVDEPVFRYQVRYK